MNLGSRIAAHRYGSWAALLAVTVGYLLSAKLGLEFASIQANVTAVWPPTGLALASVLLLGTRIWPAVFAGAFLTNLAVGTPLLVALAIAAGNTGEALVGAYLARRWSGGADVLHNVRGVLAFAAGAVVTATALAASLGAGTLTLAGLSAPAIFPAVWFTWWLGDAVGALVITPLLLSWLGGDEHGFRYTPTRLSEAAGLTLAMLFVTITVFGGWLPGSYGNAPIAFLTLPLLVWAALRFRPRDAAVVVLMLAVVAVWGTIRGHGPFGLYAPNQALLMLQGFVGLASLTVWILAATVRERTTAIAALTAMQGELEERVIDRTRDLEASHRALEASESRWRSITESSPDLMMLTDPEGRILFINRVLPGLSPERVIGSSVFDYPPPQFRAAMQACFARVRTTGQPDGYETEYRDGSTTRIYETRVGAVRHESKVVALALSAREVTAHRRALSEIKRLHHHVQMLLEATGEGIFGVDTQLRCTFVNRAGATILGYSIDELLGQDMHALIHSRHEDGSALPREECAIYRTITTESSCVVDEDVLWTKTGEPLPVQYSANPIMEDGQATGAVVIFRNIAEARAMARKMDYLATHDSLTGLVNRREFENRIRRTMEAARAERSQHVVCYLDLDQFKIVNDTCGHAAGDELLRQLTLLLHQKVRQGDTLSRLGGDEFGVLITHCALTDGLRVVNELRQIVDDFRFVWADKNFTLGVSVGVAVVNAETLSVDSVLTEADTACYMAKDAGRNRVHVYQADDADIAKRRGEMQWVARIRQALEHGRFALHAQPIVAIRRATAGPRAIGALHYEILLRMRDDVEGEIPPGAFIPAAERYNLMTAIDRWVVARTLQWLAEHLHALSHVTAWTINLSGQSLNDAAFLEFVQSELRDSGIAPDRICFEITETAAVANLHGAVRFMKALKQQGSSFALDDFGSGMSSLAYLKNLPVDYLKIDGNFVRDIVDDAVDRAMVEAVTRIAKVMGIHTVAEFVENDAILERLRSIGVDFAQGYALGKPVPLQQLLATESAGTPRANPSTPVSLARVPE